jgi:uncharacterized membrane protein HdeD (DUF308 family)
MTRAAGVVSIAPRSLPSRMGAHVQGGCCRAGSAPLRRSDGLGVDARAGPPARGWWLILVRGLVALCLGSALLVAGAGQSRLATFIGIYWLLGAVLTIRWVMRSGSVAGRRVGALAAGIGAVSALALLARQPLDDVVGTGVLLDLVGAGAIATGAMRLLGGFRDDQLADERHRKRNSMLVGALDIGLGTTLILTSDATSTWVRFLAATWGLVGGTLLLVGALRVRRLVRASAESSSAS